MSVVQSQQVMERRRQLEAELAALPRELPVPTVLMPGGGGSGRTNSSRMSSATDIRERTNSGSGRFEEVEVPSDAEGYDAGEFSGTGEGGSGHEGQKRPGSWFGWGSGSKGDYERVKSD